ncbi:LexA family transcriptional regulator [Vibrio aestuarianus subsp. cardii]|uniref:XRE family transcriptional regulator n=1 Tax=Vibrio aestuarianus TaxID=28171 RepID=UPI0015589586|nr:S24 family peptidase [Vibrio aestuarianus]NGZ68817.1 LexA family transcriptional regulator [Vibrio aestuarianus subsp. cardii]
MSDTYREKTLEEKNDDIRFFRVDIKNRFAQRLEEAMSGETNLSFAQKCGISEATIRKYKKGETTPNLEILESIAMVSGKAIQWLIGAESQSVIIDHPITDKGDQKQNPTTDTTHELILEKPKYNVVASAGGGSFIDTEAPVEHYPFTHRFLKRHRLLHADLCVIEARGESMEPTIEDGDELLLKLMHEPSSKPLEGVYVINIDNTLRVKRLEFDIIRDGYRIISDNKLHQEEFIERNGLERMKVIGEVVIVMGKPSKSVPETY